MPRGLDHIVHAVHDLEAAADLYRRLGFTVGARNRQPREWGTQNHIVQTPDTFIELLAVVDDSGMAPHGPRYFSFGAFNRDFLEHGEGLSMLVLKGGGARDADEFRSKGIGDFGIYEFEREGKRPDGTQLTFSFTLAFASDPHAPDVGFFSCQHRHPPENFWNPEFQKHANGVTATAGIVLVAREPQKHQTFMQAFVGGAAKQEPAGFSITTPRGVIEMTTPAAFAHRYGVATPDVSRGARLAAVRFVGEKEAIIGPDDAMGAVIVFEPTR